jgi:hypothetical protein
MKKIFFASACMFIVGLFSCQEQSENVEESTIVTKQEDRPKWSPVGCVQYDNGVPIHWGVQCRKMNGGGCRRSSACVVVSSTFRTLAFGQFSNLSYSNWDNFEFTGDYKTYLALWEMDPDLFIHPDSLKLDSIN